MSDANNTPPEAPSGNLRPAWQPGQSGNPKGRPKGSRNRTTLAAEALIDGAAEEIVNKAIELAKNGDGPIMRAMLERITPARKDAPISFELPQIETAADTKAASSAILAAVSNGSITPSEGQTVMALLVSHKIIVEATDFEARLAALEGRQ